MSAWSACLAGGLLMLAAATAWAQPAATAAWAGQQRDAGRHDIAVWLGKRALQALPATDPEASALGLRLAGWLAEDGRWDEARRFQAWAQAAQLAAFVGDAGHPAAAVPAVEFDAWEQGWSAAWPAGLPLEPPQATALAPLLAAPRPRAVPRPPVPRATAGELWVAVIGSPMGLQLSLDNGSRVERATLAWPAAEREHELAALALALGRSGRATLGSLQGLYRRVGAPIEAAARAAGARQVVLQVDGSLRELPWSALHDGQAFLGERLAFRLATAGVAAVPVAPDGRLQALGVSVARDGEPALPGVAQELCAIVAGPVHGLSAPPQACGQGVLDGEAWLDDSFTAERLVGAVAAGRARGGALLHLGTHFDLRPGRMARSTLLLGDGSRWPLERVAALDFSGHALVTLAACETGSAGAGAAESLQGLILHRGAQAVLASLWRVGDASTSALMQAFYRHLRQAGPAEALRRAQHEVRQRPGWAAPFHWAGFVIASRS